MRFLAGIVGVCMITYGASHDSTDVPLPIRLTCLLGGVALLAVVLVLAHMAGDD